MSQGKVVKVSGPLVIASGMEKGATCSTWYVIETESDPCGEIIEMQASNSGVYEETTRVWDRERPQVVSTGTTVTST